MYTTEILYAYEEYCIDCRHEGTNPKPIWIWWTQVKNAPNHIKN